MPKRLRNSAICLSAGASKTIVAGRPNLLSKRTVHWITIEEDRWQDAPRSQFANIVPATGRPAHERPISPQRDKDVASKTIAALPSRSILDLFSADDPWLPQKDLGAFALPLCLRRSFA